MSINKLAASSVGNFLSTNAIKLGEKYNTSKAVKGVNKFVEGKGINIGGNAFIMLVGAFTLLPRLAQAYKRKKESNGSNDEIRGIMIRDIPTILTILFALKGFGAIAARKAAKKTGLVLTNKVFEQNTNLFKKFTSYFAPNSGVSALSKAQIDANYRNISDKSQLVKFLHYIDDNQGDVKKVLTFDKNRKGSHLLSEAAEELLGKGFENMSSKEIITAVEKNKNKDAVQKLCDILSSKEKNPLANFADGINAWFNTITLGAEMAFLGFGLPALNTHITKKNFKKQQQQNIQPAQIQTVQSPAKGQNLNILSPTEQSVFSAFVNQ